MRITVLGTKVHIDHIRKAWDTAPRGEPATGLMSGWLKKGEMKGMNPPPTQPIN